MIFENTSCTTPTCNTNPNKSEFARDVLDGKLEYSEYRAKPSDLKRYQPNLVQRLMGKK